VTGHTILILYAWVAKQRRMNVLSLGASMDIIFMVLMWSKELTVCQKLCPLQRFGGIEHHHEHLDALISLQAVMNP
jgi:hypothetical protein